MLICSVKAFTMIENKNLRNFLLITLYLVSSLQQVFGENENEIKRGVFPYMAIVYYTDESIVEPSGARFSRSAVLIGPEWLISSSMETNDTQLAFPRKTLIARVGATVIDANFTFNEDEDEQEREIIQIIRPSNFSVVQWWYEDITLLKTLVPFNITTAVRPTSGFDKRDFWGKICYILVYTKKYANSTDDKLLMKLPVELPSSANENCGSHFRKDTIICANDSEEMKNIVYAPDYCHGNGGGPLVCDGVVIGIQTYVRNNCKQPHLYQLLSAWDDFISCGIDETYFMYKGSNICTTIEKDENIKKHIISSTTEIPKKMLVDQSAEDSNDKFMSEITKQKEIITVDSGKPTTTITPTTTTTPTSAYAQTEHSSTTLAESEEATTKVSILIESSSWPNANFVDRKKLDQAEESENMERKTNVEAQRHEVKKKVRNAANNYHPCIVSLFYSLYFGILFLFYLI